MRGLGPLVWIALSIGCARFDAELFDAPRLDAPRAFRCGSRACACANGLDDDGDGLADGLDDGCTAGQDDDEGAWDHPVTMGDCLDCAFDTNEGSDEGCRYPVACLGGGMGMGMGCGTCELEPRCVEGCRPLVPNGCDCFGCCAIEDGARTLTVRLGPGCERGSLDDPSLCAPCVQASWCLNGCERCERCLGAAAGDCGEGEACVLGCCLRAP